VPAPAPNAPPSAVQAMPAVRPGDQVRDPRLLCRGQGNLIARAICESRLCSSDPTLANHPYCIEVREREKEQPEQTSY
jgi:hypothetical protein